MFNAGLLETVQHGGGRRTKNLQREKRKGREEERKRERERGQEGKMYCGCETPHPLELSTNYKDKHGKGREKREQELKKTGEILLTEDRLRCEKTIYILFKF